MKVKIFQYEQYGTVIYDVMCYYRYLNQQKDL